MTWKIYQDRNGWLAGQSVGEAPNRALAQAKAVDLGAGHISNGVTTCQLVPTPTGPIWKRA